MSKSIFKWSGACLAAVVTAQAAAPAAAQNDFRVPVAAVYRDFTSTHPDFEPADRRLLVDENMVLTQLDADGRPQLNPNHLTLAGGTLQSASSFAQWFRDVPGVNQRFDDQLVLTFRAARGVYRLQRNLDNGDLYFPLDGRGFNDMELANDGRLHNFWFTTEITTQFTYRAPVAGQDPAWLRFRGDDDLFVFINDQLALCIGGIHPETDRQINVDTIATQLGLVPDQVYEMKVFHAERRRVASNFELETTLELVGGPPTTIAYD